MSALLAWQMALYAADRLDGVIALNIPFFPRPPVEPIEYMRQAFGDDFYIVNFQDSDEADRRCDEDPGRVFDVLMRRGQVTRAQFETLPRELRHFSLLAALERDELRGEALLSPAERQVYVDAYAAGGFSGPINWYRNWTDNWNASDGVEQRVQVPALFIGASDDVIISPKQIEEMRPFVDDLEIHMLDDTGHWSQQERPDEINELLIDWLGRHARA